MLSYASLAENLEKFRFLKVNFYAILKYAENDSEIYFSEKNSKLYRMRMLKIIYQRLSSNNAYLPFP